MSESRRVYKHGPLTGIQHLPEITLKSTSLAYLTCHVRKVQVSSLRLIYRRDTYRHAHTIVLLPFSLSTSLRWK